MPVYASGINPSKSDNTVSCSREAGYRDFKLKVGFGIEQDLLKRLAWASNLIWPAPVLI
jgi:hypothetical protein